jgi:hypothetical protein
MADLFDNPLSPAEVAMLPDKMIRRYWAAEISDGVVGLSALDRTDVRRECRSRLAWARDLSPGQEARYVGISSALLGKRVAVEAVGDGISIGVSGFTDRFLVDRSELEAI